MSKQSDAKAVQGYDPKPLPKTCVNCTNYRSDFIRHPSTYGGDWTEEKNMRCSIGGFSVKKKGTCLLWAKRETKV